MYNGFKNKFEENEYHHCELFFQQNIDYRYQLKE